MFKNFKKIQLISKIYLLIFLNINNLLIFICITSIKYAIKILTALRNEIRKLNKKSNRFIRVLVIQCPEQIKTEY
jgi:hypothetical protein